MSLRHACDYWKRNNTMGLKARECRGHKTQQSANGMAMGVVFEQWPTTSPLR